MTVANQSGKPTVVVVGGGYGGTAVARALAATSDVVLVEPKDAFMHNIAALRALVDPTWLPRIFLPYEGLLTNGRVVRDRAVVVDPGRVVTASGEELAGEIRAVWPEKSIVLLDVADEVLGGPYKAELKAELRRQLLETRVELILGSPLRHGPSTEPGELGTFAVTTEAGT